MDSYNLFLNSRTASSNYSVVFGAELLPANGNRGPDLLTPQAMNGVTIFLDRLRELGVQGVTIPIGYPLYTPDFPRYGEYVRFFKQVAQEVRKRDLKFALESAVAFANTPFSNLKIGYAGLNFEKFKAERKQMIRSLVEDLNPDYLNLGAEPDTEYQLTGVKELNSPERYAEYIDYVLTGLDRGGTKIGAGIGTWGNVQYLEALVKTGLDSIHTHIYPVTGNYLRNLVAIADIAKQHGKRLILDEAWLLKVDRPLANSVASSPEAFRRDAFSFWAPLDQKFLATIARSAKSLGIEYISPFWTQFFFGYVDYNSDTANLSYQELAAMANRAAANNILSGRFTSTGEFYKQLISANPSTTYTISTSTNQQTSTPGSAATEGGRTPGHEVILLVAATTLGLVVLTVLRHGRREGSAGANSQDAKHA